ncbi:MAG: PcfJ domain-containing protein [Alphaproteobacteria bacterium]|nr:PcfJ domain-containing protein [Alphaproteobacteria bacterium]
MTRRPHPNAAEPPIPKALSRHMRALGFARPDVYFDWCWANGFDGSFDKSQTDLQEEVAAYEAILQKRARHGRLHKNPKAFLEAVCLGELTSDEIERPNYKRAAVEIEASNEDKDMRASLLDMLLGLIKYDDLIFQSVASRQDMPFIRGLIKLHDRKALWLKSLADWKPKSKSSERRFGELTHHLFDKYDAVPRFMESAWLRTDRASWRYRDWYVHLGRGYNLRTAKTPVPLTKKMAHHFLQAPDSYTIEQAVRWGQLSALGCGKTTIDAVCATRLGRSFENEEFWFTVLRFVADNPMLDPRQIGPIVDYLQNQRFEPTDIEVAPGEWRQEPPPQPGLSMHGRTVDTLMRQVAAWHETLGRYKAMPSGQYDKADIDGVVLEKRSGGRNVRWIIRQLLSSKALQAESEALRHCVASYHWSCARRDCTIWSLSMAVEGGEIERCQTIEVNKNGVIVQCRGLANCDPTAEEWSIVNEWARHANLQIAMHM